MALRDVELTAETSMMQQKVAAIPISPMTIAAISSR